MDVMNGDMFYYEIKKMEDLAIRSMCQSYGTQSHVAAPIYDDKQHLIGILALDWVFSDIPSEFLKHEEFNKLIKEDLVKEAESLKSYI